MLNFAIIITAQKVWKLLSQSDQVSGTWGIPAIQRNIKQNVGMSFLSNSFVHFKFFRNHTEKKSKKKEVMLLLILRYISFNIIIHLTT